MQQVGWRRPAPGPTAPLAEHEVSPGPAHPHRPGDHPAPSRQAPNGSADVGARARVRAAYEAQVAAGQTPTGAGLARAAGVSERYGQRLLAEFTADPAHARHPNGADPARASHANGAGQRDGGQSDHDPSGQAERR
jgi:hypothetical protein